MSCNVWIKKNNGHEKFRVIAIIQPVAIYDTGSL